MQLGAIVEQVQATYQSKSHALLHTTDPVAPSALMWCIRVLHVGDCVRLAPAANSAVAQHNKAAQKPVCALRGCRLTMSNVRPASATVVQDGDCDNGVDASSPTSDRHPFAWRLTLRIAQMDLQCRATSRDSLDLHAELQAHLALRAASKLLLTDDKARKGTVLPVERRCASIAVSAFELLPSW